MNIDFARKLELAYHQQCKALCDEFHLKQTGFDILMFLGNNPQYKHAKDIVEIRKIKANLVSINVEKLVHEGLLERKHIVGDRRKVELSITEKANAIVEKGRIVQKEFIEQLMDGIDENTLSCIRKGFQKMEKNIIMTKMVNLIQKAVF